MNLPSSSWWVSRSQVTDSRLMLGRITQLHDCGGHGEH